MREGRPEDAPNAQRLGAARATLSHLISPGGPGKEQEGENPCAQPTHAPNPARCRATYQFSTRSGREGGKWREATRSRVLSPAWALGDTARATITTHHPPVPPAPPWRAPAEGMDTRGARSWRSPSDRSKMIGPHSPSKPLQHHPRRSTHQTGCARIKEALSRAHHV